MDGRAGTGARTRGRRWARPRSPAWSGRVDVAVGDTLSYQVLRSDADPRGWLSVEAWPSGFVDVSVGRFWPVDRIVSGQSLNR